MIYVASIGMTVFMCTVMSVYLVKSGYFSLGKNADFVPITEENITLPDDADVKDESKGNSEDNDESDKETAEEPRKEDKAASCYNRVQCFMLTAVFVFLSFAVNCLVYTYVVSSAEEPSYFLFMKMAEVGGLVYCAALTDYKRRKIPNKIILFGLIFRGLMYIPEFIFARDDFVSTLKKDGLGFLVGFVMLFVIAVITRGGISYGDVKLFGVMGITAGCAATFFTLFVSLLLSSIIALVLIAMRKKTFKSTLPMAPFICAGYYIICILGTF